jgi:hypothetical protein
VVAYTVQTREKREKGKQGVVEMDEEELRNPDWHQTGPELAEAA